MSQTSRNAPTVTGMGQRPRVPVAPGERLKAAPGGPRGPGGAPFYGGAPGAPPPPFPHNHVGFRLSSSHGSVNTGGVPSPPPYPPPPYNSQYYGMVPHGANSFECQPTGMARGYGYGYGPPPPVLPMVYPSYTQAVAYPSVHAIPPVSDMAGARTRQDYNSRRSAGLLGRDPRPLPPMHPAPPPPPPAPEPRSVAEAANAMGLPIRPGKPDCKHFLSRGWCSYGRVCKYNHPDVAPSQVPIQQPVRAVAPGQGVLGWMHYPVYGWPMPAGTEPAMYAPGWSPSAVMYYPPAPPPLHKVDKRHPQPPNYSARSSDSTASASSRMVEPIADGVSDHKVAACGALRR